MTYSAARQLPYLLFSGLFTGIPADTNNVDLIRPRVSQRCAFRSRAICVARNRTAKQFFTFRVQERQVCRQADGVQLASLAFLIYLWSEHKIAGRTNALQSSLSS